MELFCFTYYLGNTYLQESALQKVSHLSIIVLRGNSVHLMKGEVDLLLKFERSLDSLKRCAPLVIVRLGNVLKNDTAAPHVLVFHELLGVVTFFIRVVLEELGEKS